MNNRSIGGLSASGLLDIFINGKMRTETEIIKEINRLEDDAKNAIGMGNEEFAIRLYNKISILKWALEPPKINRHILKYLSSDKDYTSLPKVMCFRCFSHYKKFNHHIPLEEAYYDTDPDNQRHFTDYFCATCAYELADDLSIFEKTN